MAFIFLSTWRCVVTISAGKWIVPKLRGFHQCSPVQKHIVGVREPVLVSAKSPTDALTHMPEVMRANTTSRLQTRNAGIVMKRLRNRSIASSSFLNYVREFFLYTCQHGYKYIALPKRTAVERWVTAEKSGQCRISFSSLPSASSSTLTFSPLFLSPFLSPAVPNCRLSFQSPIFLLFFNLLLRLSSFLSSSPVHLVLPHCLLFVAVSSSIFPFSSPPMS